MTRVDDQFVRDMVEHTINNAETEEAQEIIKGFWGFVEVTYPLPKGTDYYLSVTTSIENFHDKLQVTQRFRS